jgi:predicted RNA binding protein YcfA (HicA-like mRNA interferase family)
MAEYYRQLATLLRSAGWQLRRSGKGSHESWWHPQTGASVTVPRTSKSRHTMNEVLKQAGLPKAF